MKHEAQFCGYPISFIWGLIEKETMKNELQIKPLMKYDITYHDYVTGPVIDSFTAESHEYIPQGGITRFYRTGNIIREYQVPLMKIVVTPVNDEQIPE